MQDMMQKIACFLFVNLFVCLLGRLFVCLFVGVFGWLVVFLFFVCLIVLFLFVFMLRINLIKNVVFSPDFLMFHSNCQCNTVTQYNAL